MCSSANRGETLQSVVYPSVHRSCCSSTTISNNIVLYITYITCCRWRRGRPLCSIYYNNTIEMSIHGGMYYYWLITLPPLRSKIPFHSCSMWGVPSLNVRDFLPPNNVTYVMKCKFELFGDLNKQNCRFLFDNLGSGHILWSEGIGKGYFTIFSEFTTHYYM